MKSRRWFFLFLGSLFRRGDDYYIYLWEKMRATYGRVPGW